jgi:sporulation protein YlmC with PRC-barrel domain
MQVDLDAKVQTRDGRTGGQVKRAIIDPQAKEISDFVISTGGLFGYDVLLQRERLETSAREGDVIRLDLTLDELNALPEYDPADYTVPATGWLPPSGVAYPIGGLLLPVGDTWREPSDTWHQPPGVWPGPEGDAGQGQLWPEIEKGTVVRDHAGEEIGVVDDLRFGPATGRLQQLIVRIGGTLRTLLGGGETVGVDISQVDRVADATIYLRLDKRAVGRGAG